jgi:hypothetical protein
MGGRVIERGGDFICGMNAEDAVGYDLRHKCRKSGGFPRVVGTRFIASSAFMPLKA